MLGKLASLKMVAHDLGAKAGVIPAQPDPVLDALSVRCAAARRRADSRRAAAAAYARAARALAEAAGVLVTELQEDAEEGEEVKNVVGVVGGMMGGVGREAEGYAGWARKAAELELGGVGERVESLKARKVAVDAVRGRVARAERKGGGGSVGEGRAELEVLREAARMELQRYRAEREEVRRMFDRVAEDVKGGRRRAGRVLVDGLTGALLEATGLVEESAGAEGGAGSGYRGRVDWLGLADDLRLARSLKYSDPTVVELLPNCRNVRPAVLPRSTLRCMTFRAPCESGADGPVLHWAAPEVDAKLGTIHGEDEEGEHEVAWVQYIVVKGTNMRNMKHLLLDFSVGLVRDDSLGCSLHCGFYEAGTELAAHAAKELDPALPVRVIGHSLGGAAAAIAALLLRRDGYSIEGLHLYGTPRFIDADGAALLERVFGTALLRVAHYDDVVRTLPPPGRARYRHAGRLVLLHTDDSVWSLDESPEAEPARGVASGSRGFAAHRTSFYEAAIARQVARVLGEPEPVRGAAEAAIAAEVAAADTIAKYVGRRDGVSDRYDKPAPSPSPATNRRRLEALEAPPPVVEDGDASANEWDYERERKHVSQRERL